MQKNSEQLQMFPTNPSEEKELICLQEDFHARLSQLLEEEKDLMTPGVLSFLKSKGFCEITPTEENQSPFFYWKTLKVCIAMTINEHLLQSIKFLPTLIIPLNAKWLILNGGYPLHKTGKESTSLADIMETDVDEKYFLSTEMHERLKAKK